MICYYVYDVVQNNKKLRMNINVNTFIRVDTFLLKKLHTNICALWLYIIPSSQALHFTNDSRNYIRPDKYSTI